MAGFKVLTLVVVPGIAVCMEETAPFPAGRPESGSGFPFCPNATPWKRRRNTAGKNGAKRKLDVNVRIVIVLTERTRLTELTTESPDAQRKKPQCQSGEAKEVSPEIAETAALDQGPAHNGRKVMDWVQDGQRLHPFRHAFDGIQ